MALGFAPTKAQQEQMLENTFTQWVQELIPTLDKEIVPIDGKSLRGSYDRQGGHSA